MAKMDFRHVYRNDHTNRSMDLGSSGFSRRVCVVLP
jgi:hypothetical protein